MALQQLSLVTDPNQLSSFNTVLDEARGGSQQAGDIGDGTTVDIFVDIATITTDDVNMVLQDSRKRKYRISFSQLKNAWVIPLEVTDQAEIDKMIAAANEDQDLADAGFVRLYQLLEDHADKVKINKIQLRKIHGVKRVNNMISEAMYAPPADPNWKYIVRSNIQKGFGLFIKGLNAARKLPTEDERSAKRQEATNELYESGPRNPTRVLKDKDFIMTPAYQVLAIP